MGYCLSKFFNKRRTINTAAEAYYLNLTSAQITDNLPKEQVQLNMSLTGCNSSNPYLINVSMSDELNNYRVIGKTNDEYADNTGVINFSITFVLDYFFEKQQNIVLNVGKNNKTFSVTTTLGSIMGSRHRSLVKSISKADDRDNSEKLIIYAKTPINNNIKIGLQITAEIQKKSNMFYIIKKNQKYNEESILINVYKSEVAEIKLGKATFNNVKIPASVVCNGDYDNMVLIQFHDFNEHKIIGEYKTNITNLLSKDSSFKIVNPDNYQELKASVRCDLIKEHTFLDFIRGGMQIALTIGIDFTGSNGNPNSSSSLHSINLSSYNSYEKAIRSCGDIVAYYDYDQMFPVYGYGAVISGTSKVSHCFPINMNNNDPNVHTIDGVISTYKNVLQYISLSGPTYFAPLIYQFMNDVKSNPNPMTYNILMILTDGMINDMDDTIDSLVEASFMPISIIIIGIGKNDFGNMDILDADVNPLIDRTGRKAARDTVQFVPFYKFDNDGNKLAEQVLEEVPRQVLEYYRRINMPPGDPIEYNK